MSAIISRWRSNAAPGAATTTTSSGKPKPPDASALDHLLDDSRPLRHDGSDKFFGMHNPSNTCYANSVLQCLYFSEQFRHNVIGFPAARDSGDSLGSPLLRPKLNLDTDGAEQTVAGTQVQSPLKPPADSRNAALQRSPSGAGTAHGTSGADKQDSFDERKKQLMAAGPHVHSEANHDSYGMPVSLFTSLKDLFEAMIANQARTGVVVPTRLMEQLREDHAEYKSPQHQDAHEFLNLLLNAVVDKTEEFSKTLSPGPRPDPVGEAVKSKASWIRDLFQSTMTSETRCLTCENVSQRDEIFLDIPLDLEEHSSVSSCLQRFSQEEMLCERNKFECDKCCGLQEAEKRMKIRKLPKILALHLKRFKYDENLNVQKLFHRVVFPFHLRLFNTTDDAEDPDRLYELYAVVVHLGSTLFHGHYVSIIKTKDRGWLLFDDELVLPVDTEYIRNFFGGQRSPACAYVLFYQQTTVEAATRENDIEEIVPKSFAETSGAAVNNVMSPTTPGMEEAGFTFDQGSPTIRPSSAEERDFTKTLESPTGPAEARQPSGHLGARKSGEINVPRSSFELPPSVAGVFKSRDSKKSSEISDRLPGTAPSEASTELNNHAQSKGVAHYEQTHQSLEDDKSADPAGAARHGSKKSSGLSRFRATSFSMRSKSKFWSTKTSDKEHKDGPENESHERDMTNRKSGEKDRGTAAVMNNLFRQDKPKKVEKTDYEVAMEEVQANEPLLPTPTPDHHEISQPMIPGSPAKQDKEKGSRSKLWGRSDKTDKLARSEPRAAPEEGDELDGRQPAVNESPEKSVKHRASRFGLGRKKSGNALG